eukprot:GHUV01024403.1.p1 GENE.GHUV01024403.1~~GHUV01024403.1.p1  ORF type:complete len:396 (+),score=69.76 GHUV01024403.1:451-1638(+)
MQFRKPRRADLRAAARLPGGCAGVTCVRGAECLATPVPALSEGVRPVSVLSLHVSTVAAARIWGECVMVTVRETAHGLRPQRRTIASTDAVTSSRPWMPARRLARQHTVLAKAAVTAEHLPVVITGAGIAGLSAAVALHKCGVPVTVLERAPALRQEGSAVALWSNAWRGLDALGVGQQLRQDYKLLERVELCNHSGRLLKSFALADCTSSSYSGGIRNETRGVLRAELLQALAQQLPTDAIQYNTQVVGVHDTPQGTALLQLADGNTLSCDVLIGADGANSVVAQHLGLQVPPNYAGYVAYRGVAEYSGSLPLPDNTIRQMWGAGVRAGMYPLSNTTAYWYICFNADEDAPRPSDPAGYVSEALSCVRGWSWDVEQAVRNTDPGTISRGSIRDR